MIRETGRVIGVAAEGLWVETIQQSACHSCAAEKGCGQALLSKITGKTTAIRVLLAGRDPKGFAEDDQVVIGIPENVVVGGTLLVYLTPLTVMIAGVMFGQQLWGHDAGAALGGALGLLLGGLLVRVKSYIDRHDSRLNPILLEGPIVKSAV